MKQLILYHEDGESPVPSKLAICGTCRGRGHHNPHAYSADEFAEAFPFPEDVEDYLSGAYDRCCDDCEGSGRVSVPDYQRMSASMASAYREQLRDDAAYLAEVEAERRFGC